MSYLTDKTMDMLKYNHRLTKKYNCEFKFGIGNCFAKLVFLISEFDNEFIYLLEMFAIDWTHRFVSSPSIVNVLLPSDQMI